MSLTIEISERSALLLARQAEAHGVSVDAMVEALIGGLAGEIVRPGAPAAVARILEIQKRVKPDPDGLTASSYIAYGRR